MQFGANVSNITFDDYASIEKKVVSWDLFLFKKWSLWMGKNGCFMGKTDEDKDVNTELIPTFVKELKIYETVNSEKLSLFTWIKNVICDS